MTSRELRQSPSASLRKSFLDFFAQRDHHIIASSSLKPSDETTLFTSAGMQPFVPWFRGIVPPSYPRVATCQKCFRADDIEEVGRTPWHCTFFEMLGNFSFGDYFKKGAIEYAWEYVTKVLQLPASRIWITVNPEDKDAPEIWHKSIGIPRERIVTDPTNWWGPVGKSGPCGPNTELQFDRGEDKGCGQPDCNPTCSCSRFTEIWNLVFPSYNRLEDGRDEPLPKPGIDTGLGFERVTALMQGVASIFETDLLAPIVSAVIARARQADPKLDTLTTDQQMAAHIIAEHTRAATFLIADGFTPSNKKAGHVLRSVIRRAYIFGDLLGIKETFLHTLIPTIIEVMGPVYPEIITARERVTILIQQEEKAEAETLKRGKGPLKDAIKRAKSVGPQKADKKGFVWVISGEDVFKLRDTYGLPLDFIRDYAAQQGTGMSEDTYNKLMDEQRKKGRAHAEAGFAFKGTATYADFAGKTRFVGYKKLSVARVKILAIIANGKEVAELSEGEVGEVIFDVTPFYVESGGQIGDTGELRGRGLHVKVTNTVHPPATTTPTYNANAIILHIVETKVGVLRKGQSVGAYVDSKRRQAIARAHTATHLLHYVLRDVLGPHALQSGSEVKDDWLRFDFAHFSALTPEEKRHIEESVVALALADERLTTLETTVEDARSLGATALFGEKYGERVRVVQIGEFSKELCGGTHLDRTAPIGSFRITSEGSIGAGLRRIEAVTGMEAYRLTARQRELLEKTGEALGSAPEVVVSRVESLQSELRQAHREIARLQQKSASAQAGDLLKAAVEVNGIKLLTARVELPPEALRNLADDLLSRLGSGIVVLGTATEARVQFVGEVSKDLVAKGYHAGNLIREVAKVAGGGGGGRPDFAQAGGKNPERLEEALAKARELVAKRQGLGAGG